MRRQLTKIIRGSAKDKQQRPYTMADFQGDGANWPGKLLERVAVAKSNGLDQTLEAIRHAKQTVKQNRARIKRVTVRVSVKGFFTIDEKSGSIISRNPIHRITAWYSDDSDPDYFGVTVKGEGGNTGKANEFICIVIKSSNGPAILRALKDMMAIVFRQQENSVSPNRGASTLVGNGSVGPAAAVEVVKASMDAATPDGTKGATDWVCGECTFQNHKLLLECEMCGGRRGEAATSKRKPPSHPPPALKTPEEWSGTASPSLANEDAFAVSFDNFKPPQNLPTHTPDSLLSRTPEGITRQSSSSELDSLFDNNFATSSKATPAQSTGGSPIPVQSMHVSTHLPPSQRSGPPLTAVERAELARRAEAEALAQARGNSGNPDDDDDDCHDYVNLPPAKETPAPASAPVALAEAARGEEAQQPALPPRTYTPDNLDDDDDHDYVNITDYHRTAPAQPGNNSNSNNSSAITAIATATTIPPIAVAAVASSVPQPDSNPANFADVPTIPPANSSAPAGTLTPITPAASIPAISVAPIAVASTNPFSSTNPFADDSDDEEDDYAELPTFDIIMSALAANGGDAVA